MRPAWLKHPLHQFAGLCAGGGFLLFMLVHETGTRATHGNFMWQAIYANHLLYWVVLVSALDWRPASAAERRRRGLVLGAIGLHLASGLIYLAVLVVRKSYI